jgi:hypothetical protein
MAYAFDKTSLGDLIFLTDVTSNSSKQFNHGRGGKILGVIKVFGIKFHSHELRALPDGQTRCNYGKVSILYILVLTIQLFSNQKLVLILR